MTPFLLPLLVALPAARAESAPTAPEKEAEVVWNPEWHRVRPWEYVAAPVFGAGSIALRFAGPQPDRNWKGGILFDDALIDAIAVRGEGRDTVATVSDSAFYGAMAFRLVDSAVLPGIQHHAWDVALQMSFIDLEAFAISGTLLWGTQLFVGRERPYVQVCRDDPEFAAREADCEPSDDWNRSFFSGHPAIGVTAAALTCLHHTRMPLYGKVGDPLVCGLTIAMASANGIARVMSEKHYGTDLVVGVGVGLFAGYVVPRSLHYGWRPGSVRSTRKVGEADGDSGTVVLVLPLVTDKRVGLSLAGSL
jgi:membrane-associated phospholipid phosphatase